VAGAVVKKFEFVSRIATPATVLRYRSLQAPWWLGWRPHWRPLFYSFDSS